MQVTREAAAKAHDGGALADGKVGLVVARVIRDEDVIGEQPKPEAGEESGPPRHERTVPQLPRRERHGNRPGAQHRRLNAETADDEDVAQSAISQGERTKGIGECARNREQARQQQPWREQGNGGAQDQRACTRNPDAAAHGGGRDIAGGDGAARADASDSVRTAERIAEVVGEIAGDLHAEREAEATEENEYEKWVTPETKGTGIGSDDRTAERDGRDGRHQGLRAAGVDPCTEVRHAPSKVADAERTETKKPREAGLFDTTGLNQFWVTMAAAGVVPCGTPDESFQLAEVVPSDFVK